MSTVQRMTLGAVIAALAVGCGGSPEDFEGADNTDERPIAEDACEQLRLCCMALQESAQVTCYSEATDPVSCTTTLGALRSAGSCS